MLKSSAYGICRSITYISVFRRMISNTGVKHCFLPPTIHPDEFLKYSYTLFMNDKCYSNMIVKLDSERTHPTKTESNLESTLKQLILNKYKASLKDIEEFDKQLATFSTGLDISSTFRLFSAFHIFSGIRAFRGSFYRNISTDWAAHIESSNCKETLLMLFYLAQSNPFNATFVSKNVGQINNFVSEYSIQEFVIISHSLFRLKIKIPSEILHQISQLATKELLNLSTYSVIAIIKSVRLANYFNKDLFAGIENFVMKNIEKLNITECVHMLAFFANARFYNEILFGALERKCAFLFENELSVKKSNIALHPSIRPRSKDIARFIWSLNHLCHTCSSKTQKVVIDTIYKMIREDDFEPNPHHLVDCLQSLSLQEIYLDDILNLVFSKKFIKSCQNLGKTKPLHQLYFLGCSVAIEHKDYKGQKITPEMMNNLSKFLTKSSPKHLNEHQELKNIRTLLETKLDSHIKLCCVSPLPHIRISGIVLKLNNGQLEELPDVFNSPFKNVSTLIEQNNAKVICLEMLDSSNCVRGTNKPLGLLRTKIRHLKKLNLKVICLDVQNESFTSDSVMNIFVDK